MGTTKELKIKLEQGVVITDDHIITVTDRTEPYLSKSGGMFLVSQMNETVTDVVHSNGKPLRVNVSCGFGLSKDAKKKRDILKAISEMTPEQIEAMKQAASQTE